MTREEVFTYIEEQYGVMPDFPFNKDFVSGIFRHKHNRKWFAAALVIPKSKLGVDSEEVVDILDLKCDPLLRGSLLNEKGIYSAYHMNKVHWLTIVLNEASEENIKTLLDISFSLTKK